MPKHKEVCPTHMSYKDLFLHPVLLSLFIQVIINNNSIDNPMTIFDLNKKAKKSPYHMYGIRPILSVIRPAEYQSFQVSAQAPA